MFFLALLPVALALQPLRRGDCRTQTVVSGDTCEKLAQKCGISGDDFTKYNQPSPCSTLQEGQLVCCSSGTKPSRTPKQNSDGSCYAYTVQSGDYCAKIASSYDISVKDLSTFNDKTTWGWAGCNNLQAQTAICLSTGSPPLPPPVDNAICGPTKPGTTKPKDGTSLASLNPCPLNVCCNKWGQCGSTPDFCTAETGPTGNPGTAPAGKNGCVSNCGLAYANVKSPSTQINVGYYESWNFDRPCLTMKVTEAAGPGITHLHWAFANVDTNSFTISVNDTYQQFEQFKGMSGVKRIVSIGGWGYSTEPATYDILRRAMNSDNSKKFAANIVSFLNQHNLDGIDIDWEYPGAPDNQGVSTLPPTGGKNDVLNYWLFLYNLRQVLPSGKTMSIAAPSSYWYLKAFSGYLPSMVNQLDYMVYMTYDLHGQWDYNNKWAIDGCPAGNCLRSHVNFTETQYALAMVTKAGVPTNKIVVGISSYGRSFGLTNSGCTGPMCTFKGPASGATPGKCTGTAGYISNAEIADLVASGGRSYYDQSSDSDMATYGNGQWVAYMSDNTRQSRKDYYQRNSFLGSADWAVDLLKYGTGADAQGDAGLSDWGDGDQMCDWNVKFNNLDDLSNAAGTVNAACLTIYAIDTLTAMLDAADKNYTDVNNGYDDLFKYYQSYIYDIVNPVLIQSYMFDNWQQEQGLSSPLGNPGKGFQTFDCSNNAVGKTSCYNGAGDNRQIPRKAARNDPMSLTLRDPDAFGKGLADFGLIADWVRFGDWTWTTQTGSRGGAIAYPYPFKNFPQRNDSMVVPNPKDIITGGLLNIPQLRFDMLSTVIELKNGIWNGGQEDPAQVYSVPIFMYLQAIDGMAQAKTLAAKKKEDDAKAEADRKKDIILTILSVALFFVPFVGEAAATAAGLATLARTFAILGELANGAYSIYEIVKDPKGAWVNVFGLLFGIGAIAKVPRTGSGLSQVAGFRKGMSGDQIATFGTIFKGNNDKLQGIARACRI